MPKSRTTAPRSRRRIVAAATAVALTASGLAVTGANMATAQGTSSYNSTQSAVNRLVSRMTLDEKLTLLSGGPEDESTNQYEAGYLPGVPRLGIPSLRLVDGPPGVATKELSTGMTQTMGLAATFSTKDAKANGEVIGTDAKALGQDVVLEPFINIDRDPASARGWNTYGEDPLLTGALGAEEIRGIQSKGIMAQAKHFIGFDGPTGNVVIDQQAMHEVYLKPFQDAVLAGVSSVMCSYNQVNGEAACGNSTMLNGVLKEQLKFEGFVTSDWGAVHSTKNLEQGLDMEMPGANTFGNLIPTYLTPSQVKNALNNGSVSLNRVNDAVTRILGQYKKFGLLDGQQKHTVTPEPIAENAKVVQQTAENAATLLKNDSSILPLSRSSLSDVALIGPGAGQTMATGGGGEKATGRTDRWIGTTEALKKTKPRANISYAVADNMTGTTIPASALSHDGQPGLLRTPTTGAATVDAEINFTTAANSALPVGSKNSWSGTLTAPETGTYWINFGELGTTGTVAIDGKNVINADSFVGTTAPRFGTVKAGDAGVLPSTDGLNNKRVQVTLTAGAHTLGLTNIPDISNQPVQVHLNWVTPSQQQTDHDAAVATAAKAKTAVVFAWSTGSLATALPEGQDQLIADIAKVNPNTVVVLNTNQPVGMPWIGSVKGVLNMWFPGDEGAWATANVLTGKVNPSGHLPFTWPKNLSQGVASDPAHPERASKGVNPGTATPCTNTASGPGAVPNCETTYSEGINVGYRWYDANNITPLYPFGYGLSYGEFSYSKPQVTPSRNGDAKVTFTIKNNGTVAGTAVPQVYLGAPSVKPEGTQFAVKALSAFDRVSLKAGQSERVTLTVNKRELSYWNTKANTWSVATGTRQVLVGNSSRDLPAATTYRVGR